MAAAKAPQAQPEAEAAVQTPAPEAQDSQAVAPDAEARVQAPGQDAQPQGEPEAPQAAPGEPAQDGGEPEAVQAPPPLDSRAFLNRVNDVADAIAAGRKPDRILDNMPEEQRELALQLAKRLAEERQRTAREWEQRAQVLAGQQAELLAYQRQRFAEFERLNAQASKDPLRAKDEDEAASIYEARDELLRLSQQDPELYRSWIASRQQAQVTPALRQQLSAEIAQSTIQAVLAASRAVPGLDDLPDEEFAAVWNEAAQHAAQGGGPAAGFAQVMRKAVERAVEAATAPLKEQVAERDRRIEALERQVQGLGVQNTGAPSPGKPATAPNLEALMAKDPAKLTEAEVKLLLREAVAADRGAA